MRNKSRRKITTILGLIPLLVLLLGIIGGVTYAIVTSSKTDTNHEFTVNIEGAVNVSAEITGKSYANGEVSENLTGISFDGTQNQTISKTENFDQALNISTAEDSVSYELNIKNTTKETNFTDLIVKPTYTIGEYDNVIATMYYTVGNETKVLDDTYLVVHKDETIKVTLEITITQRELDINLTGSLKLDLCTEDAIPADFEYDKTYRTSEDKAYVTETCPTCGIAHGTEKEMKAGTYIVVSADSREDNYFQKVLNTNINGKTIVFAPGEYNEIIELSPSKETATIIEGQIEGSGDTSTLLPTSTEIAWEDIVSNQSYVYERHYQDITFAGTEDAVFNERVVMVSGIARNYNSFIGSERADHYDPVKDGNVWPTGMSSNTAFALIQHYDNLKFVNMNFEGPEGRIFFHLGYAYSQPSSNLTVENCTFITDTPHYSTDNGTKGSSWDAAIHVVTTWPYLYEGNGVYDTTQKSIGMTNVNAINNTIKGHYQGITLFSVNNVNIFNNTISETEHTALSLQTTSTNSAANNNTGLIKIKYNTIFDLTDRSCRIAGADNATFIVDGNTISNVYTADDIGSYFKATGLTNSKFTFTNNTYGGVKADDVVRGTNASYNIYSA